MPSFRPCRWTGLVLLPLLAAGQARAGLRFEQTAVAAGEVRSGAPLVREFRFRNDGPEEIEVLEARPSCGCLRPTLAQRSLRPGEVGTVRLEVNTLTQAAGPHTWQLHLPYRQGNALRETTLAVTAVIVPELTVQPAALTLLTEGTFTQEVVLTDLRARPLDNIEVRTTAEGLKASLGARTVDGAGHPVFHIRLEVSADCPEGRHEEALDIYSSDPLYRHLQVPVTVVRQAHQRLTALPAEVTIRTAPGQPIPSQLLRVRDAHGAPVVIAAVTADDPAVACRWARGPDHLATVRIQIDRGRLAGTALQTAVHIRVVGPVPETITVPVRCTLE